MHPDPNPQVLRLGAPVTALSLSPSLDMLATCHTNRKGVYLWANQAVFGNPADFSHSDKVVDVALPTISTGACLRLCVFVWIASCVCVCVCVCVHVWLLAVFSDQVGDVVWRCVPSRQCLNISVIQPPTMDY